MRRPSAFAILAVTLAASAATSWLHAAQTTDVRADYERARTLRERVQAKVQDVVETPTWIEGSQKFWYRKSVTGGNAFVLVDPVAATKGAAFDHERLAASLSTASGIAVTAV